MRTFRANQDGKLASILRTSNAQIGVQPATIDVQLDGRISSLSRACRGAKKTGWKGKWSKKKEGKVKGNKVCFL